MIALTLVANQLNGTRGRHHVAPLTQIHVNIPNPNAAGTAPSATGPSHLRFVMYDAVDLICRNILSNPRVYNALVHDPAYDADEGSSNAAASRKMRDEFVVMHRMIDRLQASGRITLDADEGRLIVSVRLAGDGVASDNKDLHVLRVSWSRARAAGLKP